MATVFPAFFSPPCGEVCPIILREGRAWSYFEYLVG